MHCNWVQRIHCVIEEAAPYPLRAKQIAIRCGCLWDAQYASVRHALRREVAKGHLSQDTSGRYRRGVVRLWQEGDDDA